MISHKYRCIFIHIPKCAGTSINKLLSENTIFDYRIPNYDFLYGWCPKRKLFLQHATVRELLELDLISNKIWNEYYKFTIIRNPWDRLISSYNWIKNDLSIKGNLNDFLTRDKQFSRIDLLNPLDYRADHLKSQSDYIFFEDYKLNDIYAFDKVQNIPFYKILNNNELIIKHFKKSNKNKHYSQYFTNTQKEIVKQMYKDDILNFSFEFIDKRSGINQLKKFF